MKHKPLTQIELYAASAWLARVSLHELAGKVDSQETFKACHRIYTRLNMMADKAETELDKRKEAK